jgi:hypothetical protein
MTSTLIKSRNDILLFMKAEMTFTFKENFLKRIDPSPPCSMETNLLPEKLPSRPSSIPTLHFNTIECVHTRRGWWRGGGSFKRGWAREATDRAQHAENKQG